MFSEINTHLLYGASTIGDIRVIDVRDGKVVQTFNGHASPINDMKEVKEH